MQKEFEFNLNEINTIFKYTDKMEVHKESKVSPKFLYAKNYNIKRLLPISSKSEEYKKEVFKFTDKKDIKMLEEYRKEVEKINVKTKKDKKYSPKNDVEKLNKKYKELTDKSTIMGEKYTEYLKSTKKKIKLEVFLISFLPDLTESKVNKDGMFYLQEKGLIRNE